MQLWILRMMMDMVVLSHAHCLLVDFDADVEVQGDVDIVVDVNVDFDFDADVAGGVHIDVHIRQILSSQYLGPLCLRQCLFTQLFFEMTCVGVNYHIQKISAEASQALKSI